MKDRIGIALCLLLAGFCALAAPLRAQSFFAMRGLGEEMLESDAASAALGGIVVGSPRNPAWPITLPGTSFTVSAMLVGNYGTSDTIRRLIGDGRPTFFRARFPLPAGFRAGFGFSDWYNQDFAVYSESTPSYRRYVVGKGGIYDLNAVVSRSFGDYASFAIEYSRLISSASEVFRLDAFKSGQVTFDTSFNRYGGDAIRVGAYGRVSDESFVGVLGDEPDLGFGGFYERVLDLGYDQRTRSRGLTTDSSGGPISLPSRYGLGLAARPNRKLKLYLEGVGQLMSEARLDTALAGFRNAYRVMIGGEYALAARHPLRFGLRWQDWYLTAQGGRPVREIAVTAGSALPLADLGTFDFAVEYAYRYAAALKENVLRAQLSLYFVEPWKRRTRNWGY